MWVGLYLNIQSEETNEGGKFWEDESKVKKSILSEAWCAYHSIVAWLKCIIAETVFKVHIIVALRLL